MPTSAVTLFGLERSVYTRIARLALEEKGVDYALTEMAVYGPGGVPAEHRDRLPFGRVPALQHGEFQLYEASAITRYVDDAFEGPSLQPDVADERARMNQIISVLDAYAYQPMVWGVFVERVRKPLIGAAPDEALIEQSLAAAQTVLEALNHLAAGRLFLAADRVTLADLHAYPMLRWFSLAEEGKALLAGFPRLGFWLATMQQRPSVRRTRTKYEDDE